MSVQQPVTTSSRELTLKPDEDEYIPPLYRGEGGGSSSRQEDRSERLSYGHRILVKESTDVYVGGLSSSEKCQPLTDNRWYTRGLKYQHLRTLNKRRAKKEVNGQVSRSTQFQRRFKIGTTEAMGSQLGLQSHLVSRAQNIVLNVDNLSSIGDNSQSNVEAVALVALGIAHRESFARQEWRFRRFIPYEDNKSHQGRLITETEEFEEMLAAINEVHSFSVEFDDLRAIYEKGFSDSYPSPFPEDLT